MQKELWVYILNCEQDRLYTGYTVDITKRFQSHVKGTGRCKFTMSFKPIELAQCWQVLGDKKLAMQIERYIKKLPKAAKKQLILDPEQLKKSFAVEPIPSTHFPRRG